MRVVPVETGVLYTYNKGIWYVVIGVHTKAVANEWGSLIGQCLGSITFDKGPGKPDHHAGHTHSSRLVGHWEGPYSNTRGESGSNDLLFTPDSTGQLFVDSDGVRAVVSVSGNRFSFNLRFVNFGSYRYEGTVSSDGRKITISYANLSPADGSKPYSGTWTLHRK